MIVIDMVLFQKIQIYDSAIDTQDSCSSGRRNYPNVQKEQIFLLKAKKKIT